MTSIALAGCLGEAAIIGILVILLRLSAKLGAVTKMRPYYIGYYAAIGLVSIAFAARLLAASFWFDPVMSLAVWLRSSSFYVFLHHGSLALGVTLALPITVKYWGWLLHEQ